MLPWCRSAGCYRAVLCCSSYDYLPVQNALSPQDPDSSADRCRSSREKLNKKSQLMTRRSDGISLAEAKLGPRKCQGEEKWQRERGVRLGKKRHALLSTHKGSNKPFCWTPFVIPKCSNTNLHPPPQRGNWGEKNVFWDSWIPFSKHPREHLSLRWHWHDSVLLWACSFACLTLQMHSADFCSTILTKKSLKVIFAVHKSCC